MKKTIIIALSTFIIILLGFNFVSAKKTYKSFNLPDGAVEIVSGVFSLGETIDKKSGKKVSGFAIIHKKENKGKPAGVGGGKGKDKNSEASCYGFLAKGAKWKSVEPWVVNATNPYGITSESIYSILENGVAKWEDASDGKNILGNGYVTIDELVADTSSLDGLNEVYFGQLDEGTIGVTIIWGVFGGAPKNRELVEWDQVYNILYEWSDNGEVGKMDFDNIATHELGHSVGMGDLYESTCADMTMYGYGTEGETKKRNLEAGDITGIQELYL